MSHNLQLIKSKIGLLYANNPNVHISYCLNNSKTHNQNITANITGVYPNIFTAQDALVNKKIYNFQYVDILIGRVKIKELDIEEEN